MADWWTYPVTQGYSPPTEFGVDIGTPFHTAITSLLGGTVKAAGYHPWGGEVDIATKGGLTEYVLHLDQIPVGLLPGTSIKAGQVIGLSGGQLAGGAHPAGAQYSSGPHVEYGLFSGSWGKSVDPTALVKAGYKGSAVTDALGGAGELFGKTAGNALVNLKAPGIDLNIGDPFASLGQAAGQIAGSINSIPTQIGHGLADFFVVAEQDIAEWLKRQTVAFFVAAVVLLVLFA